MLNWCYNWRRNSKSTHRITSVCLLSTERLSGTSISIRLQSSYLHLKVFPSVSLHKLLAYSNSIKDKCKMKKYALSIWQTVIKERQFWELSLWHFSLAVHQGDSPSQCLVILYLITWCVKKNQKSAPLLSNDCIRQRYKKGRIFQCTVLL